MSLHYIIDGYNLIKHQSFQPAKKIKDERFCLLEFIRTEKLCGSPRNKITVVFDGYAGGFNAKDCDIEVIFSQEQTADEKIKKIIQSRGSTRNAVVISDDKEIKYFVRSSGMKAVGVEEFIRHKKRKSSFVGDESLKPELTYSAMHKINQELRQIWLR
jgi:predicted RNA-binding protein with PIN domain